MSRRRRPKARWRVDKTNVMAESEEFEIDWRRAKFAGEHNLERYYL